MAEKKAAKKAASTAAARKRASVRAAERTETQKRVKKYGTATRPTIVQAGVGNIPVSVARAAMTIAKHLEKSKKSTQAAKKAETAARSRQAQQEMAQTRAKAKREMDRMAKDRAKREAEGRKADSRPKPPVRQGTTGTVRGPKGSERMRDPRPGYGKHSGWKR